MDNIDWTRPTMKLNDGNCYQKDNICQWLKTQNTSPLTRAQIAPRYAKMCREPVSGTPVDPDEIYRRIEQHPTLSHMTSPASYGYEAYEAYVDNGELSEVEQREVYQEQISGLYGKPYEDVVEFLRNMLGFQPPSNFKRKYQNLMAIWDSNSTNDIDIDSIDINSMSYNDIDGAMLPIAIAEIAGPINPLSIHALGSELEFVQNISDAKILADRYDNSELLLELYQIILDNSSIYE
jgi:hypothetical protein